MRGPRGSRAPFQGRAEAGEKWRRCCQLISVPASKSCLDDSAPLNRCLGSVWVFSHVCLSPADRSPAVGQGPTLEDDHANPIAGAFLPSTTSSSRYEWRDAGRPGGVRCDDTFGKEQTRWRPRRTALDSSCAHPGPPSSMPCAAKAMQRALLLQQSASLTANKNPASYCV